MVIAKLYEKWWKASSVKRAIETLVVRYFVFFDLAARSLRG